MTPRRSTRAQSPRVVEARARSGRWRTVLLSLAIAAAACLVYSEACGADWNWDDDLSVYENPLVVQPHTLGRIWLTGEDQDYWPLTRTAFSAAYAVFGSDPLGYHVVNVVLHAVTSVLVFLVLRRLGVPGALVAGLVFAVHPVNAANVVWISQLKTLIATSLTALSALAWLRYRDGSRRGWYAAALLAFAAALAGKTSVVTWPAIMLGMSWWQTGRISRRDVLDSVPFFGVAAAMALATVLVQAREVNPMMQPLVGIEKVAGAGWVFWFYVWKTVWPVGLSAVYPHWKATIAGFGWIAFLPSAALAGLVAACWAYRGTRWGRALLAAVGYSVLAMAPVLGFVGATYSIHSLVADHYQYLPCIGVIALACAGATVAARRWPRAMRPAQVGAVVVLLVLSAATVARARVWATPEALWADTLEKNPDSWVAHYNLATRLTQQAQQQAGAAIGSMQESQRLAAEGAVAASQGNEGRARDLRRAADERQQQATAAMDRIRSQSREAISHDRRSIELQPLHTRSYANLGLTLFGLGGPDAVDEAIAVYRRGADVEAQYFGGHRDLSLRVNLGKALVMRQRFPEAVVVFRAARDAAPDDPAVKRDLAEALTGLAWLRSTSADASQRDAREALAAMADAQSLMPRRDAVALDVQAAVLANAGRFGEAVAAGSQALELARQQGNERLIADVSARVQMYAASQPYRAVR